MSVGKDSGVGLFDVNLVSIMMMGMWVLVLTWELQVTLLLSWNSMSTECRFVGLTSEFVNEGLLKVPSLELLRDRSLVACRSQLILKCSGKFRLISIPSSLNARFRRAGGLVDFLRFLRTQVAFVFRPSLPSMSSAFVALSNLRALFPVGQR
ncbi:unnamed protein product [Hydatigera taeniaeformis]|uniref:Secreted protein n=1 Tax=Hydatigena taeniaeformis TaxID=6205 RepID=A0A0R3WVI9_HYDTA|nr:unnamed protein product [Hydatigera taeniaeformis]